MSADSEPPPPAKYSRYRSVRQAAASKSPPPTNTIQSPEVQNGAIQRSMSRYHRRPRVSSSPAQDVALVPTIPQRVPVLQTLQGRSEVARTRSQEPRPPQPAIVLGDNRAPRGDLKDTSEGGPMARGRPEHRASINQRENIAQALPLRGHGEQDKQVNGQLPEEDDVARKLAEQKQKDLQRLEMELAAAATRPSSSPERSNSATHKPSVEKFRVFTRMRAESKATPSKSSSSLTEAESQEVPKVRTDEPPQNVSKGGGGVVPGVDAPKSAVNAGERRVLIRCKQCSINLPITPDTTPIDLIFSAANVLSVAVTPSASILLESYAKLGLERRIRRYEHIRDIMNSWDRDTQNALVIQGSDSPNHDFDLDASSVPRVQPSDVTVYMYHSQKPGKWDKRYITLDSTGQIFISKKKDAKVTDKDIVTLCHLTDFDIYTPTADEIRKNLRPPKKYCYAVKSQQKTAMFLNTEKFVHFFSTDDYDMANKWYDGCQQWRSWYLVNIKGEGKKNTTAKVRTIKTSGVRATSGSNAPAGHKAKISVDENPYTIGSFKPLMDLSRFQNVNTEPNNESENTKPRQIPFHLRNSIAIPDPPNRRDRHPPPVSYRLPPSSTTNDPTDASTFAPTGLLGRTYSQRQRAQNLRTDNALAEGPFIPGPSLLNAPAPGLDTHSPHPRRPKTGIEHARSAEFLSPAPPVALLSPLLPHAGHGNGSGGGLGSGSGHKRTASTATRARPKTSAGAGAGAGAHTPTKKPLVDLTPKFVEAPQWSREGKGRGVAAPDGVPLVDVAGGPGLVGRRVVLVLVLVLGEGECCFGGRVRGFLGGN